MAQSVSLWIKYQFSENRRLIEIHNLTCKRKNGDSTESADAFDLLRQFTIYLKAAGWNDKESDVKVAILLNVIGQEAVDLFETFDITTEKSLRWSCKSL